MCLYLAVCILLSTVIGSAGVVFADDDAEGDAESTGTFYAASTAITAFASRVMSGSGNDKHENGNLNEFANADPGNAGAVVGYGDKDKTDFGDGVMSNDSHSSTTSSYDGWYKLGAVYTYVRYGHLLADLGYDSTGSAGSNIIRFIGGGVITVCYYISRLTPQVFNLMINLLRKLNPFQFMRGAGGLWSNDDFWTTTDAKLLTEEPNGEDATKPGTKILKAGDTTLSSPPAALKPIVDFFQKVVKNLQELSWTVIIPLMFIIMLASLLLARGSESHKVLTFVKRIVLITVGVPILGLLYTIVITSPSFEQKLITPQTSTVVANTFVDFADWVSNKRLDLPKGSGASVALQSEGDPSSSSEAAGSASNTTLRASRRNAARINNWVISGGISDAMTDSAYSQTVGDVNQIELTGGVFGAKTGSGISDVSGIVNEQNTNESTAEKLIALLTAYTKGDFYSAGAWTGVVTTSLSDHAKPSGSGDYTMGQTSTGTGSDASNNKTVGGMWQTTAESKSWLDRSRAQNKAIMNGSGSEAKDELAWAKSKCNVFSCGELNASNPSDGTIITYSGSGNSLSEGSYPGYKGGLSAMSLYNYLNTEFNANQVKVYSTDAASSGYVKATHYAVSMVGSGLMRIIFWLSCIACVGIIGVVGLVMAVSMVFSNVKRGISVIAAIPGAYLGVLKSMAQIVTYVVLMIFEFLGTILLYELFAELLCAVTGIAESVGVGLEQGAYATVIGGQFASMSGVQSAVYGMKGSFMLGVALAALLVLFIGVYTLKCRKQIMFAYNWVWSNVYRLATMKEAVDLYDEVLDGRLRGRQRGKRHVLPVPVYMMHLL